MWVIDGNKVRSRRDRLALTQMALATAADSSPSYISTVENAPSGVEMSVDLAHRIAKALSTQKNQVRIEDLLTEV